jgi:D-ribose pyranose/furanose isomerase RbsD
MKKLIDKYTKRLSVLKENRAQTVDTNTDSENAVYDDAINRVAEFIRDLKTEGNKVETCIELQKTSIESLKVMQKSFAKQKDVISQAKAQTYANVILVMKENVKDMNQLN